MARLERSQVRENLSLLGKHPISNKHIFTKLDVKGQNVSAIDILEEFPFLQDVDVANNQIESLAPLAKLPFLLSLNAENNQLETLLDFDPPQCTREKAWIDGGDQAIGSMVHIVNLSRNKISTMRDLTTHQYIQELVLDHNQITHISGISQLVFLKYLSLAHNKLTTTDGLTKKLPIEILNLSHNEIADTAELSSLPRLLTVNLAHNKLRSLADLGKCRMLQLLDVSHNRIKDLREIDALTPLRDLSDLNLSNCPITRISFYRYRVLVRTQQLVKLDHLPASVKERIKAKVLHGGDMQARKAIFDSHMKGDEEFTNNLPPLEFKCEPASPSSPNKPPSTESCKDYATREASKAIGIAQVKVFTERLASDILDDMPRRYPLLFGKSCSRKLTRRPTHAASK
ncbi:hypothetical protein AC1031_010553 [Aphanomyces cochlioides]|nr:hypothetical protein AC1031_010553 [Aphanomyces cochlioides]